MRPWARTFVYTVVASGLLNGLHGVSRGVLSIPAAQAAESVDRCVSFDRTEGYKSLDYSISNDCEMKLTCTMSWTLRCQDNHGKVTHRQSFSRHFKLLANDTHSVSASAARCRQSWDIDNIRWRCDEVK